MDFLKAMQPVLHCWCMYRHGSNVITPMFLPVLYSIVCRWDFTSPAQIIIDAKNHEVIVKPADINDSFWDNTLEEKEGKYCVLRLGFRQIRGMREDDMKMLLAARSKPFTAIHELRNIGLSDAALERLADADAFRSIGLDRKGSTLEGFSQRHSYRDVFRSCIAGRKK
jgi:DNA polymerase III alpha subunit